MEALDRSSDLSELDDFSDGSDVRDDELDIVSVVGVSTQLEFSSSSEDNYDSDNSRGTDQPPRKLRHIVIKSENTLLHEPAPNFTNQSGTLSNRASQDDPVSLPEMNGNNSLTESSVRDEPSQSQNSGIMYKKWVQVNNEEPIDVSSKFLVKEPGPRNCPTKHCPINYFLLFITEEQLALIAQETNTFARLKLEAKQKSGDLKQKSRIHDWRNITVDDIKKFLAILFNMGLTKRNSIDDYWSADHLEYMPWYSETMSLRKFKQLYSMLHLTSTQPVPKGQPGYDPWVQIRPVLDAINHAFKQHYEPFQNLSLVEDLVEMKNKCPYVKFMYDKHRNLKCGIKKFELIDSNTMYVLSVELFSGKDHMTEEQDPYNPNFLINLLEKGGYLGKGYHVFTKNLYTKLPFSQLLSNNTYFTGIMNKIANVPTKSLMNGEIETEKAMYFRKGSVLLVSYKENPTKKPLCLVTTAYHAQDILVESNTSGLEATKPFALDKYDQLMEEVDKKYEALYQWSCSRQSAEYWIKLFFNLLDICVTNSYILYSQQCMPATSMSKKQFILELIRALTTPSALKPAPEPDKVTAEPLHRFDKMPNRRMRHCSVCTTKKRTAYWCTGCNVAVHKECFNKLEHYWRHVGTEKKCIKVEDSDTD